MCSYIITTYAGLQNLSSMCSLDDSSCGSHGDGTCFRDYGTSSLDDLDGGISLLVL